MGLEVTVTYACSVNFILELNCMKLPFPDVFGELLFLYASSFSPKCLILSSKKYQACWSFKLVESNQFKVDIKSRTGLT